MLKEFNLQTFFRYFIPGAITLGTVLFFLLFVNGKGYCISDMLTGLNVGEGIAFVGVAFIVGYLIASLYHFTINFPGLRSFMRLNHKRFFVDAFNKKLVTFQGIGVNGDKIQDKLSTSGSAALFDVYFYRLRRQIDDATDEKRFEGFFDLWNGLGSTLIGMIIGFLFWVSLDSHSCKSNNYGMIWIPILFFLMGVLNWIQLRRWSRSYVESWFCAVLEKYKVKEKSALTVYVREENLRPLENLRDGIDPSFWVSFKRLIANILHH